MKNDYSVKDYLVIVKHDKGRIRIKTAATSLDAAIEQVCNYELCPRSAILHAGVYPTKKQIQKTKKQLSNL